MREARKPRAGHFAFRVRTFRQFVGTWGLLNRSLQSCLESALQRSGTGSKAEENPKAPPAYFSALRRNIQERSWIPSEHDPLSADSFCPPPQDKFYRSTKARLVIANRASCFVKLQPDTCDFTRCLYEMKNFFALLLTCLLQDCRPISG